MEVSIPRDRNGEFEPQLIKKYQNTVTQDMQENILSMYAKECLPAISKTACGNSMILRFLIVLSTVFQIRFFPSSKSSRNDPRGNLCSGIMVVIHYHVRSECRTVKRAVYVMIGISMESKKNVLDIYMEENESTKLGF